MFDDDFFVIIQEAEKMVAYLQEGGVDEERLAAKEKAKHPGFPLTHEAALKWFYKDPQGEMQGEGPLRPGVRELMLGI